MMTYLLVTGDTWLQRGNSLVTVGTGLTTMVCDSLQLVTTGTGSRQPRSNKVTFVCRQLVVVTSNLKYGDV